MDLPLEIPEELRAAGIPVDPESDNDEIAWQHEDALRVLDSLRGTKVAVLEVFVYVPQPDGDTLLSANTGWACEPALGETASDFAVRSHEGAIAYMESLAKSGTDEAFYSMLFSEQDDAA